MEGHEGAEYCTGLFFVKAEIVVEEKEKLLLHDVDLFDFEHVEGVLRPVSVLWAGVVEIFGSTDERGEEDPVSRAQLA